MTEYYTFNDDADWRLETENQETTTATQWFPDLETLLATPPEKFVTVEIAREVVSPL